MGKAKRRRLQERHDIHGKFAKVPESRPHEQAAKRVSKSADVKKTRNVEPTIPFVPLDQILLVGEGDFSFAYSLVSHHGCANVVATCLDTKDELFEKYPQAGEYVKFLESEGQGVLYGVDATKLAQKQVRRAAGAPWDRIVFNFPHVGGKSTDVNRQVRYNQELLVSFFKAAMPLLAPSGSIVVTLFENPPYSLWNVRDLARHVGLKVVRSFKFRFEVYPEYKHARTLGNLNGSAAWRGDERSARTYVFENSSTSSKSVTSNDQNKNEARQFSAKRKAEESSSDEHEVY